MENIYIGAEGNFDKVVWLPNNSTEQHYLNVDTLDEGRHYSMPKFPEFPKNLVSKGNFSTYSVPGMISEDGYYEKIDIYRLLTIDVGSGTRKIRTKELNFYGWGNMPPHSESSAIVIEGTGNLELYVDSKFGLPGSSSINYGGDIDQVAIYYQGDDDVVIDGAAQCYGCFFPYRSLLIFI